MFEINKPEDKKAEFNPEEYLQEIVGEGKKFSSIEEAAKALAKKAVHADSFIETLKKEKSDLEIEYERVKAQQLTAEQIVERLNKFEKKSDDYGDDDQKRSGMDSLTEEKVQEIIAREKAKWNEDTKREEKDKLARKVLLEAFENNEEEMSKALYSYAGDDENKRALVVNLGHTDPMGLVKLIKGSVEKETFTDPMRSRGGMAPPSGVTSSLTWSEAKRIKRESPGKYASLGFQKKLLEAQNTNPNFFNT